MSACEKCWADSRSSNDYHRLVMRRNGVDEPSCTPEQQAGPGAAQCPVCKRMTLHQHTGEPMCGCKLTV
jgi:hypothetical protein